MKMIKPPPEFKPVTVQCRGLDACGAEMGDVQFSDLKRHEHKGDSRDQREASWTEIYVECMGCGKHIEVKDVPAYLTKRIPES